MDQPDKLRAKLVEYVQNVLLMFDSIILTTNDPELAAMFREHKEETGRRERRLDERLKGLGGLNLTSTGKDFAALAAASGPPR